MLDLMLVSEISKLPPCTGNESFGVMDMAFDLKLKVRGLRTVQKDQDWRKNELWVYRPQDTYAMGWICYADHMTGGDGENRYSVFSPNISNGKYTHGDREYMSSALNRDTAVKNAAKYLRPLTLQQTVRLVQKEFKHKLNTAAQQMGTELRGLTSELRDGFFDRSSLRNMPPNALQNELNRIMQSDYVFVDKELEQKIRATFAAREEYEEGRKLTDVDHTFIEAYQLGGRQCFRAYDKVKNYSHFSRDNSCEGMLRYTQEDLPEHLKGPISVLSMVDVGQYVVGVGYRAGSNMFYVKCE